MGRMGDRLRAERLCLLLGSVLILAAVCLYVYDRLEDARAGAEAASAVSQLRQSQSAEVETENEETAQPAGSRGPETPQEPDEADSGAASSGPEWSKANLKVSPCRQCGSVAGRDLVIAAHNYKSHFGRLSSLKEGDEVRLTLQDGTEAVYAVERLAQLSPEHPEAVREGNASLVLYTCTPGGKARVTVYCRQK